MASGREDEGGTIGMGGDGIVVKSGREAKEGGDGDDW